MSDSSRHALYSVAEVTFGVTPVTPNFKKIRHTGASLGLTKAGMLSEEIRSDRQISEFRHGNKQTSGDISGELSYGTYDDYLQAALCGTWAAKAAPYTASTLSTASADNSLNSSANLLPVLSVGDRVTLSGFTAGSVANNQTGTVVSSTSAKMVLATAVPLVTQAAGAAYTVTTLTQVLKAGVLRRSFSVLRDFTDIEAGGKRFHIYPGQEISRLALNLAINSPVKATFGFVGKTQGASSDTAPAGTTYTAENSNAIFDAYSGSISEGGVSLGIATELSLSLENGIQPRFVLMSDSTIKQSIGQSNLTGQVTVYFEDAALYEKFQNEVESSISFSLSDKAGNGYRFTLPRIKYTDAKADTQGQGSIPLPMSFQALWDATTATNLLVERNPAA